MIVSKLCMEMLWTSTLREAVHRLWRASLGREVSDDGGMVAYRQVLGGR